MNSDMKVVIYFDDPEVMGYPFDHRLYYESYIRFSELAAVENVDIFFARGSSYQGNMKFSSGWKFVEGKLVEVPEPIQGDIVYIKGEGNGLATDPGDLVINSPEFDDLCHNKLKTYKAIGEFMAPTYAIDETNWREVVAKIPTSRVVLKPVKGGGGKGVIITEKEKVNWDEYNIHVPYLAQAFIDASGGVPGITEGVHDLRVILFGSANRLCYVRSPKEGTLLANISLGAAVMMLPLERIPQEVIEIVDEVDKRFAKYTPRIYTIDFMFENGKPFIGEINPRPGIPHPEAEGEDITAQFLPYLLASLKAAVVFRRQGTI